jgi:hypothetical protein
MKATLSFGISADIDMEDASEICERLTALSGGVLDGYEGAKFSVNVTMWANAPDPEDF